MKTTQKVSTLNATQTKKNSLFRGVTLLSATLLSIGSVSCGGLDWSPNPGAVRAAQDSINRTNAAFGRGSYTETYQNPTGGSSTYRY